MNRKGTLFLSVVTSVFIFMAGMLLMNFLMGDIDLARGVAGLNCDAPTSDGVKVSCLGVDIILPYFILLIVSIAGGRIINNII